MVNFLKRNYLKLTKYIYMRINNSWFKLWEPLPFNETIELKTDKSLYFDNSKYLAKNNLCTRGKGKSFSSNWKYSLDINGVYEINSDQWVDKFLFKIPEEIIQNMKDRNLLDNWDIPTYLYIEESDWLLRLKLDNLDSNPNWLLNLKWDILLFNKNSLNRTIKFLLTWEIKVWDPKEFKYRKVISKEFFPELKILSNNSFSINDTLYYRKNIKDYIDTSLIVPDSLNLIKNSIKFDEMEDTVIINNKKFKKKHIKLN